MYCYFRNIADFYNKVSQILDTQSKKTLWKFILLKLTPPHQEYCLNKINLSEEVLLGKHWEPYLHVFNFDNFFTDISLVIILAALSIGLEYLLACSVWSQEKIDIVWCQRLDLKGRALFSLLHCIASVIQFYFPLFIS